MTYEGIRYHLLADLAARLGWSHTESMILAVAEEQPRCSRQHFSTSSLSCRCSSISQLTTFSL